MCSFPVTCCQLTGHNSKLHHNQIEPCESGRNVEYIEHDEHVLKVSVNDSTGVDEMAEVEHEKHAENVQNAFGDVDEFKDRGDGRGDVDEDRNVEGDVEPSALYERDRFGEQREYLEEQRLQNWDSDEEGTVRGQGGKRVER